MDFSFRVVSARKFNQQAAGSANNATYTPERHFKLTIEEGGLSVVRDLTKHPAYWKEPASAHELATIATRMAQTAHELGGQTVPPMPA